MKVSAGVRLGIGFFLLVYAGGCAQREPAPTPAVCPPVVKPPSTSAPPPVVRGQKPYQVNGIWYYPIPSAEGYVERGLASWYGSDFHGRPTSCGEPYDMYAMTAAHKTLPLGTHVKVTNLNNGRSVVVRVNDRGPFVSGRIIDLSYRAAQEIGSARPGLAPVVVEAVQVASEEVIAGATRWNVQPIPSFRYGQFAIQIGSFQESRNADRLKAKMERRYGKAQVFAFNSEGTTFYRVQVGGYGDMVVAQEEMQRLRRNGFQDAFVVASDTSKE